MSFRKRPPISYGAGSSVREISENEDGKRVLVNTNYHDFALKNPISTEEYSLTQQLQAGVPLKELNVSNLIGSTDPIDNPINEEKVLEQVNQAVEQAK